MGRIPKLKPSKVVTIGSSTQKKRRKKKTTPRRSGSSTSAMAASTAAATVSAASPVNSSTGSSTPSSHSKECEQCGNSMILEGVTKAWSNTKKAALAASSGCQVCDFVVFRKTQRPCVHCERNSCEYFCEWCGSGYHTKCARVREENVTNPNGFCCRKCEAEQDDDADNNSSTMEDVGARCGSCRLPFAVGAKDGDEDGEEEENTSGFHVNQSVLVENDEVLYNAVITDVDAVAERIKIHFIRWSKSFDNWYAMDDEHINESLACDCCNQWFHIGCLPPIKSSGRFKDTTYVCPTCIDDARAFHNGGRLSFKSKSSSLYERTGSSGKASSNKNNNSNHSGSDDSPAAHSSSGSSSNAKKKKLVVSSDEEPSIEVSKKKKRKLSVSSDSPAKKKPDPPVAKAKSPERTVAAEDEGTKQETHSSPKHQYLQQTTAPDAGNETKDPNGKENVVGGDDCEGSKKNSTVAAEKKSQRDETPPPPVIRRKVSSNNSVSALLNSPSPNEDSLPVPFHTSNVTSLPTLDASRRRMNPSSFNVKLEREPSVFLTGPTPQPPHAKFTHTTKSELSLNSVWLPRSSMKKTRGGGGGGGRGSLSAFDILREVATQSIGGELVPPLIRPPKRSNGSNSDKKLKADAATSAPSSPSALKDPQELLEAKERIQLNSFVDLHFNIRKEMYIKFCMLEEEGLLTRDNAQLLRSLIYPTSDKFQDLKFVYLVNKDVSSDQLTKRLLEVVPLTSTGVVVTPSMSSLLSASANSSPASTPLCHAHQTSVSSITDAMTAAAADNNTTVATVTASVTELKKSSRPDVLLDFTPLPHHPVPSQP